MNEKVKAHIAAYNKDKGWKTDEASLIKTLLDGGSLLYREELKWKRWWAEFFYVVDVGGMKIGYRHAETTRDENAEDVGYEFDPDSICEVVAEPFAVTKYRQLQDDVPVFDANGKEHRRIHQEIQDDDSIRWVLDE